VPKKRLREFFELLTSSGFRAQRRGDFVLSRCCESLDCLTLAYFGLINVFPVRRNAHRQKIAIFLSSTTVARIEKPENFGF